MFVKGIRGLRGIGEYVQRTPQDWKIDNWIGQPIGGGLQPAPAAPMGISTTTAVEGGLGLAALALAGWAAWKYFK